MLEKKTKRRHQKLFLNVKKVHVEVDSMKHFKLLYKLANFAIKSDSILSKQLQLITIYTIEVDRDCFVM